MALALGAGAQSASAFAGLVAAEKIRGELRQGNNHRTSRVSRHDRYDGGRVHYRPRGRYCKTSYEISALGPLKPLGSICYVGRYNDVGYIIR